MPGSQAALAAAPSLLIFDDDDDDDDTFGDFKFASSSTNPKLDHGDDDEWGDFLATPLGSHPSEPPSPSLTQPPLVFPDPPPANSWERPRGALPLSLFGDVEADEDDADLEPHNFANGFSSTSLKQAAGSGSKGDLKDLIVNLYGPAPKTADSLDAGVKKEGKVSEVSGIEERACANGIGIQVVGNGIGESHEAIDDQRVGDVDAYVAHNGANDFQFASVIGYDHCILETNLQANYSYGNGLHSNLENGDESDDDNCWEFKDAFSEAEVVTGSPGHQEIPETEAKVVISTVEIQESRDLWENNPGDLSVPYESNREKDPGGISKEHNGPSDPNYTGIETKDFTSDVGVDFNDMILTFYDKTDQVYNVHAAQQSSENEPKSAELAPNCIVMNADSEFDMHWEFQKASVTEVEDQNSASKCAVMDADSEFDDMHWEFQKASVTEVEDQNSASNCVVMDAHSEFDDMHWEFHKASVSEVEYQNSALKLDQSLSVVPMENAFVDFYCRLREECLFLIVHHISDLKKSCEADNISHQQAEVVEINEKIQAAYEKIQEAMVSENAYIGKHPSRDECVSQLLDVIKEPHFHCIEQEYCLQERILSAGKDLTAAIELFEHSIAVLQISGSTSIDESKTYITAWSKMALACSQELQHGAMIWVESIRANYCTQILSRGNRYFMALGEIFRVSEILRASLKLYKPWILLSQGGSSEVLLTCLEKCAEAWRASDLEKALESISGTESLLESIKLIHDLDEISIQIRASCQEETICKLSLLPVGVLQGMGTVVWDGEHYCTRLANLWANRISSDPPKLPHIRIS